MKSQSSSRRGVALIIVLAMLILLSGIIVSFMSTAGNERVASAIHSSSTTTRQIADSTVNSVIGQIREATTQPDAATTWSSQPGAIRTFSGRVGVKKSITKGPPGVSGAAQFTYVPGNNDFIYKLYSADDTKVLANTISQSWDTNEIKVINEWNRTDPIKDYVDLNEPILSALPPEKGSNADVVEPRYPIIDPRAKMLKGDKANINPTPGVVDGFDVKSITDERLKLASGAKVPYLPMPVKWIYQLRDGTLTSASDADEKNPIVGRTAWWVDDESTKLNINTASEGTFWDTPTASSEPESGKVETTKALTSSQGSLSLAGSQPTRGEYQRYPGHPATTSLSPVLGWLWDILPGSVPLPTRTQKLVDMKNELGRITPFIPYGIQKGKGSISMGGSYNADPDLPAPADPNQANSSSSDKPPTLLIQTKHLYTTVDELLFGQERFQDGGNEPPILNGHLTPDALEKMRFFLTANSRAPEINLFGKPRVTIWPVSADEKLRTSYDDLFAFTSTLYRDPNLNKANDKPFFFTRYDAKSQGNDLLQAPASASGPNRNMRLLNYLKLVTGDGSAVPGFGGSFSQKYSVPERDQILLEMYDYMRTVNLVDTSTVTKSGSYHPYTPYFGTGTSGYNNDTSLPGLRSNDWSGQVTPIRTSPTAAYQGLGRFFTIGEAAIVFYRTGTKRPDGTYSDVQATLALGLVTPTPGFPIIRETFYTKVRVDRATRVNIEGTAAGEVDIELVGKPGETRVNISNVSGHDVAQGRNYLPMLGCVQQMHWFSEPSAPSDLYASPPIKPDPGSKAAPKKFEKDPSTEDGKYRRQTTVKYYPYVSNKYPAPLKPKVTNPPTPAPMMKFKAGAYTVEIWSGEAPDDPRSQKVQEIHLDFPADEVTVPLPGVDNKDCAFGPTTTSSTSRLTGGQESPNQFFDSWNDVIRGLELVTGRVNPDQSVSQFPVNQQGDVRLAMARSVVPAGFYQPRGGIAAYRSREPRVFVMHRGHGELSSGSAGETLPKIALNGAIRDKIPFLPAGLNGVAQDSGRPGDWDRGLSKHVDGAFANKVDEGNVRFGYDDKFGQAGILPYFRGRSVEETGRSFFSPNRQISSAVMFGSLPTGVVRGKPWQTLLFRPDRGTVPHPGAQTSSSPADHLLLDLFHLPIVEPYAISEPFSTAGKVNLNYVIAPFGYASGDGGSIGGISMPRSYVRRDTALRGVLKAVKMMTVATSTPNAGHDENPLGISTQFRWDIDSEKTLDLFEDRLKDPQRGLFRSASEICDMDLFPMGSGAPSVGNWGAFWDTAYAQTGDNMRERPYSYIYPRVTTKSNVFTVHMRCQAIKKAPGTSAKEFVPGRDQITSEYRGSAVIERFIDPNDSNLQFYNENTEKVDPYYRFRIISTKQFAPR